MLISVVLGGVLSVHSTVPKKEQNSGILFWFLYSKLLPFIMSGAKIVAPPFSSCPKFYFRANCWIHNSCAFYLDNFPDFTSYAGLVVQFIKLW